LFWHFPALPSPLAHLSYSVLLPSPVRVLGLVTFLAQLPLLIRTFLHPSTACHSPGFPSTLLCSLPGWSLPGRASSFACSRTTNDPGSFFVAVLLAFHFFLPLFHFLLSSIVLLPSSFLLLTHPSTGRTSFAPVSFVPPRFSSSSVYPFLLFRPHRFALLCRWYDQHCTERTPVGGSFTVSAQTFTGRYHPLSSIFYHFLSSIPPYPLLPSLGPR